MKDVFSSLETDAGNHGDPITRRTSGPTTRKHKPDFSAVLNNFKMVFDVIDVVFVCPTEVSRIKLLRGP